jgi:hypothetical protein
MITSMSVEEITKSLDAAGTYEEFSRAIKESGNVFHTRWLSEQAFAQYKQIERDILEEILACYSEHQQLVEDAPDIDPELVLAALRKSRHYYSNISEKMMGQGIAFHSQWIDDEAYAKYKRTHAAITENLVQYQREHHHVQDILHTTVQRKQQQEQERLAYEERQEQERKKLEERTEQEAQQLVEMGVETDTVQTWHAHYENRFPQRQDYDHRVTDKQFAKIVTTTTVGVVALIVGIAMLMFGVSWDAFKETVLYGMVLGFVATGVVSVFRAIKLENKLTDVAFAKAMNKYHRFSTAYWISHENRKHAATLPGGEHHTFAAHINRTTQNETIELVEYKLHDSSLMTRVLKSEELSQDPTQAFEQASDYAEEAERIETHTWRNSLEALAEKELNFQVMQTNEQVEQELQETQALIKENEEQLLAEKRQSLLEAALGEAAAKA